MEPSSDISKLLVRHKTFLRLIDRGVAAWADHNHFFAVASLAMRHVLVDHARRRLARKRGGGLEIERLDEDEVTLDGRASDLAALDTALERLRSLDERLGRVVDLHFFGGLSLSRDPCRRRSGD